MASPPLRLCSDLGSAAAVTTAVSPPRDIIFEILSWLPAKPLCRCRCVSKEWRSLISSPAFVTAHRSRAEPLIVAKCGSALQLMDTEGTVVRVVEDLGGFQRFPPGFRYLVEDGRRWMFRTSLGSLVCISSGDNDSGTIVVDLATGKTLLACFQDVVYGVRYTCFGIGRTVHSGALKVFRLVVTQPEKESQQTSEVLTLGDGAKWRQVQSPPRRLSLWINNSSIVTVNGALHFLSWNHDDVLSFDLDNEKWKVIHGPQGVVCRHEAISIAQLEGALCMAQVVEPVIDIWLLSDPQKNIWTKAYTIPEDLFEAQFVVPLSVSSRTGELIFYYYDYRSRPVLQVYDPRSGECSYLEMPASIVGRVGLCSSNLDHRFC